MDQAFFVFLLPWFYVRIVAQVDLYGGHREETEAGRAEGLGGEEVCGLAVFRGGGEGGGGDMGQRGARAVRRCMWGNSTQSRER